MSNKNRQGAFFETVLSDQRDVKCSERTCSKRWLFWLAVHRQGLCQARDCKKLRAFESQRFELRNHVPLIMHALLNVLSLIQRCSLSLLCRSIFLNKKQAIYNFIIVINILINNFLIRKTLFFPMKTEASKLAQNRNKIPRVKKSSYRKISTRKKFRKRFRSSKIPV